MTITLNPTDFIISAYGFNGKGRGEVLSGQAIIDTINAKQMAWLHMDAAAPETMSWLKNNLAYLDPLIREALLAEETRPRVTEHEGGALVILRGVNLNDNAEPEDMISIRFWIDENRIISTQFRPLKAVQDIRDRLEAGKGPYDAADFFVALTTRLFQRMEPVMLELDERTDNVEEAILGSADVRFRHDIVDIRKKAIILRRYIAPQKEVMSAMRSSSLPWLEAEHKRRINENYDRVLRYVEELDAVRERAQVIKDELSSILADKMNKNMYLLSIIAAIFLPLVFLTGLLGINVGGMPGADYNAAFWIVTATCLGFIALVSLIFKFLKWF
jgi:zinc transporter